MTVTTNKWSATTCVFCGATAADPCICSPAAVAPAAADPARRRHLVQIDCWADQPEDCVVTHDADGETLFGGRTVETFKSPFAVRVFIEPGTDPARVLQLLRKAAAWIERDPGMVAVKDPYADPWATA